jgi:hypothetical protein
MYIQFAGKIMGAPAHFERNIKPRFAATFIVFSHRRRTTRRFHPKPRLFLAVAFGAQGYTTKAIP